MTLTAEEMAYITINPDGLFTRAAQAGFEKFGIFPANLLRVSPRQRLLREWRKHRFSLIHRVLLPKLRANQKASKQYAVPDSYPEPKVWKLPELNGPETVKLIKQLGIKYLIHTGAGIFRKVILDIPDLVVVNAHAGRLPYYRNMNVIEWAIYNDDPVVGTIHRIDQGIDTGAIWMQKELDLSEARTANEAYEQALEQVAQMLAPAIFAYANGEINEIPQSPEAGKSWYVMHPYFVQKVEAKLQAQEKYDQNPSHRGRL